MFNRNENVIESDILEKIKNIFKCICFVIASVKDTVVAVTTYVK